MKRVISFIIAVVLLLQLSSAVAEWEKISISPIYREQMNKVGNPLTLIEEKPRPAYYTLLTGMNIFFDYPDFVMTIKEKPFLGIAKQGNDTAIFFVLPIPTTSKKQKYKVAYYVVGSDVLCYDPEWIITISQVYSMLGQMCDNAYMQIRTSYYSEAIQLLEEHISANWDENSIEECEAFLKR